MEIIRHFFKYLSVAALLAGCAGTEAEFGPQEPGRPRAIGFSGAFGMSGAEMPSRGTQSFVKFEPDDRIIVYAGHSENPDDDTFTANFMKDQIVEYDGEAWTYSPIKYWPRNGRLTFRGFYPADVKIDRDEYQIKTVHKCLTGFERLYKAESEVSVRDGILSGDVSDNGKLRLAFKPLLNTINFTAKVEDNLFHEVESDEYKGCDFLLLTFRLSGFYKEASYSNDKWEGSSNIRKQYTANLPLDMTEYLSKKNIEESLPGYHYDPSQGYFMESAVIIGQGAGKVNLFDNTLHLIPRDSRNQTPQIAITYVVLTYKTDKDGNKNYKESGTVTRVISLSKILNNTGLIQKQININLDFSIDGVTVTRNLEDYTYKPLI